MRALLLFLAIMSLNQFVHAATSHVGPQSAGLGNTGRASVNPLEGGWLNPASLAHVENYHFGAFFKSSEFQTGDVRSDMAFVFTDNNPDAVMPGSFSYVRTTTNIENSDREIETEDFNLALGNAVGKGLAMGISGRYMRQEDVDGKKDSNFDATFGVIFTPADYLGVAFTYDNFLKSDFTELRESVGIGVHYVYQSFMHFRADAEQRQKDNPGRRVDYGTGIEIVYPGGIVSRIGGFWQDSLSKTWFTAGLGWMGPRLRLDYSFQKNTRVSDELNHGIDFSLFF